MVSGMAATSKITITLPNDQLKAIRKMVKAGRAANVSAFVKHAVKNALNEDAEWAQMIQDALMQTGGPLTDKEREWVDSLLEPLPQKRSSRKRKAA